MKLKIPPVVILMICGLAIWTIGRYWLPQYSYQFELQIHIARGIMILAVIVAFWAIGIFRRSGTTTDPTNPTKASSLVTSGVFSKTRNPMYLAMLLILIAAVIKAANPFAAVIPIFFIWYMTKYQIKPEEDALNEIFGEEYREYCKKVRRWV